jgi:Ubiquitin-2 like Rad60 SUMO-like
VLDVPDCSDMESLRLVCMGRGFLSPDTKTLEECLIPTFKTHPTPVNVSLRPDQRSPDDVKKKGQHDVNSPGNRAASAESNANAVSQGCSCVVL